MGTTIKSKDAAELGCVSLCSTTVFRCRWRDLRNSADVCGTMRNSADSGLNYREDPQKSVEWNRRAPRRERNLLPTLGDVSQAAETLGLGEELIGLLLRLERQFALPICKNVVRELLGSCEIES